MTGTEILVGLSEIQVGKGATHFSLLGLGSCVGIALRDPATSIGGVAHIMLPTSFPNKPVETPGKFANTGVPALIDLLEQQGANRENLVGAIIGGAQVFKSGGATNLNADLGGQNGEAAKVAMQNSGIRLAFFDTGGTSGRSMTFNLGTGEIKVRTLSSDDKLLGVLS